jgi:hypothetical protein
VLVQFGWLVTLWGNMIESLHRGMSLWSLLSMHWDIAVYLCTIQVVEKHLPGSYDQVTVRSSRQGCAGHWVILAGQVGNVCVCDAKGAPSPFLETSMINQVPPLRL